VTPPRFTGHRDATRARDGALRRLSALNRLAVAGAVAMVLGFSAMAAKATPPRDHTATPVTTPATTGATPRAGQSSSDDRRAVHHAKYTHKRRHRPPATRPVAPAPTATPAPPPAQASAQPAPAPAPTPQAPVAVSGGS